MNTPEIIYTGLSLYWEESLTDYSSASYTLYISFKNSTAYKLFTATAGTGGSFVFDIAATSNSLVVGDYQWTAWVSDGTDKILVGSGSTTVKADPTTSAAADYRSHARTVLDAIEAMIEGRASKEQQAITIANRTIQYLSLAELTAAHSHYKAIVQQEINAERATNGLESKRIFKTRFV